MAVARETYLAIREWDSGGSARLLESLSPHVPNATEPSVRACLFESLYAIVRSTVITLSPSIQLSAAGVFAFVKALVDGLPSTSSSVTENPVVTSLGDILIDVIWGVDSEVDDIVTTDRAKPAATNDKSQLVELVKLLISSSMVQPSVCRERLEMPLIYAAGLVNQTQYETKAPKVRTAHQFKQHKFNLLREQNEGFSKLVAEIVSLVGPPHSPNTGKPLENPTGLRQRASLAWDKIVALIGYFDLNPDRVLDVILDVFSTHVTTHHAFFLELIRCSGSTRASVDDSYQDDVEMTASAPTEEKRGRYTGLPFKEILKIAQGKQSLDDTESDTKNPIFAQILGFKFAHYQHNPDADQNTVEELYVVTALLIREGFLKLSDIYLHLTPLDSDMPKIEEQQMAVAKQKMKAPPKINALSQATSLEGPRSRTTADSAPGTKEAPQASASTKGPPDQKLGLLKALLSLGAVQPSLRILSKFPWMVKGYPEIAHLLLRLMQVSLSPLRSQLSFESASPAFANSNQKPRPKFAGGQVVPPIALKPVLSLRAPQPVNSLSQENVFFYPDWKNFVPLCETPDEVGDVISPFLRLCGVQIHRDPQFMITLARIGRQVISEINRKSTEEKEMSAEADRNTKKFWSQTLRIYIVPAISLVHVNAKLDLEVWELLKLFDPSERWAIYDEWKKFGTGGIQSRKHPELQIQAVETARETKDILRRLNATTTGNAFSVPVSKLSHANPMVVFPTALKQAVSYPNFPAYIADALEYLTPMGLDVLTYCVLNIFGDPDKPRIKPDGTSLEDWVQNLSSFLGKMLRKHQSMDPELLLRYIANQLKRDQAKELLILREIISNMTSIDPITDLNDVQVVAMAAGPTLRIESICSTTRGTKSGALKSGNTSGTRRLMDSLTRSSLSLPLLILIAQQRASCIFRARDGEWHPKYLSSIFDEAHGVLLQYIDLITTALSAEDYANLVPSLSQLCKKYGLEPAIAFEILRPALSDPVYQYETAYVRAKEAQTKERLENLKATIGAPASQDNSGDTSMAEVGSSQVPTQPETTSATSNVNLNEKWSIPLLPVIEAAKDILPKQVVDTIGPAFFVTFWQMSLRDLGVPTEAYAKLRQSLSVAVKEKTSGASDTLRRVERTNRRLAEDALEKSKSELRYLMNNHEALRTRLQREKNEWFKHYISLPNFSTQKLMTDLVQYCFHPRALLSLMDAEYCAKMIKQLHRVGTPGFSTLSCYDKLLGEQISAVVFLCSDREIQNYGRFLRLILADLYQWFDNEAAYLRECRRGDSPTAPILPGFQRKMLGITSPTIDDVFTHTELKVFVTKVFRKVLKCLLQCLASNEYTHVRNAFRVLYEILPVFPVRGTVPLAGSMIENAVGRFLKDDRNDIKVLANGYYNRLTAPDRKKLWQSDTEKAPPSKPAADAAAEAKSEALRAEGIPTGPASSLPAKPTLPTKPMPARPSNDSQRKPASNGVPMNPMNIPTSNAARQSPLPNPPTRVDTPPIPSNANGNKSLEGIQSIPRPEVIKRIRPDARPESPRPSLQSEEPKMSFESSPTGDMAPSSSQPSVQTSASSRGPQSSEPRSSATDTRSIPTEPKPKLDLPSRPVSPGLRRDMPSSPRSRREDGMSSRGPQGMPPPSAPSSKTTAHELRTLSRRQQESDDSIGESTSRNTPRTTPRSPRRRSPSPLRPGTRNHSSDSRTSVPDEKARSDRSGGDRDRRERKRENSSRHDRDRDGDRDRRQDKTITKASREGEKERERERERGIGGGRDKDRERDRESERDRDRHRRDKEIVPPKKERDREPPTGPSSSRNGPLSRRDDERSSTRPDSRMDQKTESRGRTLTDDSSHKRRRETDEETTPSKRLRESSAREVPRDAPQEPSSNRDSASFNSRDPSSHRERDRERDRDSRSGRPFMKDATQTNGVVARDRDRDRDEGRSAYGSSSTGKDLKDGNRDREPLSSREKLERERDRRDDGRRDRRERETDRDRGEKEKERERDREREREKSGASVSQSDRSRRDRRDRESNSRAELDRETEKDDVPEMSANLKDDRTHQARGGVSGPRDSSAPSKPGGIPSLPSAPRAMTGPLLNLPVLSQTSSSLSIPSRDTTRQPDSGVSPVSTDARGTKVDSSTSSSRTGGFKIAGMSRQDQPASLPPLPPPSNSLSRDVSGGAMSLKDRIGGMGMGMGPPSGPSRRSTTGTGVTSPGAGPMSGTMNTSVSGPSVPTKRPLGERSSSISGESQAAIGANIPISGGTTPSGITDPPPQTKRTKLNRKGNFIG